jgi:hypothetical protein
MTAFMVLLVSGGAFAASEQFATSTNEDRMTTEAVQPSAIDQGKNAEGLVSPFGRGGWNHGGGYGRGGAGGGWNHGGGYGGGYGRGGGWGHDHGGGYGRGGYGGGYRWGRYPRGYGRLGWWYPGWGVYPGHACYSADAGGYTYAGTTPQWAVYSCSVNSGFQGCYFVGCD